MDPHMKEPVQRKTEPFSLRIFGVFLCGVLLLIIGGSLLAGLLSSPSGNVTPLEDWQFVSGTKLKKLEGAEQDWRTTGRDDPVRLDAGDTFIRLKGRVPPTAGGTLCIRAANGGMTVRIDGRIQWDTLEDDGRFVNSQTTRIPLAASKEGRELDILLYSPLGFSFTAAVGDEGALPGGLQSLPYLDLTAAAILIVAGAALLAVLWFRRRRIMSPVTIGLLALALILWGASMLLNPLSFSLGASSSFAWMYRFSWFLRILSSMLLPFSLFLDGRVRTAAVEELVALNILYACYLLLWPYQVFFVVVIKLGLVVQIINAIAFVYGLFKWNRQIRPLTCAAQTGFLLVNLLYWQTQVFQQAYDYTAALWIAAVLCTVGTVLDLHRACRASRREETASHDRPGELVGQDEKRVLPPSATATENWPPVEAENDTGLVYTRLDSHIDMGGLAMEIIRDKCDGPYHHLLHVAEYVRIIALKMGLGEDKAAEIADASLLHDIGKVCISSDILFKPEKLTDDEFHEIKRHNQYGFHMLDGSQDEFVRMAARIAHEHHEHIDGSGYLGLKQDEICLEAKIASVADVFDALTSLRSYKKTWSFEHAFSYVQEHSGVYFEPAVVQAFTDARDNLRAVYDLYQQSQARARE